MKLWPKAKVRPIRFHDLRHTTASLLLMAGANPAAVQRILRHSDPRITTEVYGHLVPDYLRRAEIDRLSFGLRAPGAALQGFASRSRVCDGVWSTLGPNPAPELVAEKRRSITSVRRAIGPRPRSGRRILRARVGRSVSPEILLLVAEQFVGLCETERQEPRAQRHPDPAADQFLRRAF